MRVTLRDRLATKITESFRGPANEWRTAEGISRETGLLPADVTACLERHPDLFRRSRFAPGGIAFYTLNETRRSSGVARSNTPEPRKTRTTLAPTPKEFSGQADTTDGEVFRLMDQLEEVTDKARHWPLNIMVGFDDEQFTYIALKLRAALRNVVGDTKITTPSLPEARVEPSPLRIGGSSVSSDPSDKASAAVQALWQPVVSGEAHVPSETPLPESMEGISRGDEREVAIAEDESEEPQDDTNPIWIPEDNPTEPLPEARSDEPADQADESSASEEQANPVVDNQPAQNGPGERAEEPPESRQEEAQATETDPDSDVPEAPDTESVNARIAAAREAIRRRDPAGAIEKLSAVAVSADAAELLGVAHELAGNRSAALDALRRAIETEPERASAHFNYAVVLSKEGRLNEALEEAETALQLKPDYPAAQELRRSLLAPT